MATFNSFFYVYQAGYPQKNPQKISPSHCHLRSLGARCRAGVDDLCTSRGIQGDGGKGGGLLLEDQGTFVEHLHLELERINERIYLIKKTEIYLIYVYNCWYFYMYMCVCACLCLICLYLWSMMLCDNLMDGRTWKLAWNNLKTWTSRIEVVSVRTSTYDILWLRMFLMWVAWLVGYRDVWSSSKCYMPQSSKFIQIASSV
jgi:hypothetical protein